MEKYKYVLWGLGKRGKRFLEGCDRSRIIAIIDCDKTLQNNSIYDIPIIDYDDYKKGYGQYEIVISVSQSEEIVKRLRSDAVTNYFLLGDCQYEFQRNGCLNSPFLFNSNASYIIYGLNIYGILLREYLTGICNKKEIKIIAENEDKWIRFKGKYDFVINENAIQWDMFDKLLCVCAKTPIWLENDIQIIDLFDVSRHILEYRNPVIKKYKDIHIGEKCFIIGNGPSLKTEDLDKIANRGYKCIGSNRIYLAFNDTKWRPDYLVAADEFILQNCLDEILFCGVKDIFIGDLNKQIVKKAETAGGMIFHCSRSRDYSVPEKFSSDMEYVVYAGGSVTYICIQVAIYMGFKEIYLLGVDNSVKKDKETEVRHFHRDYEETITVIIPPQFERAEQSYEVARDYAEKHNIKIYNATRGGSLEVFERVNFDEIINQEV